MKGLIAKWRALNTKIQKSGLDWLLHGLFSIAVSLLLLTLLNGKMLWPITVSITAFVVPVVIGFAKELTDINFDLKDVAHYAVGSGVTVLIWNLV